MRPKRRILLTDRNEQRRSCTAFQLRIWGYALATESTHADLVLAFTPADEEKIRKMAEFLGCPSLMVWDGKGIVGNACTATLTQPEGWLLRDHIANLCQKKRGPVPASVKAARESLRAHTHTEVGNQFQVAGCPGD